MAVFSPLTLSKLLRKHFQQFISANKRYQENRKFDKLTPSNADRDIDGPGRDHLLIDVKPDRVPGLTGDMDIPQRYKIPNDPTKMMDLYTDGIKHVFPNFVKKILRPF